MVKLTQSLKHFLFERHRDIIHLLMLGHIELFNDDIQKEYLDWCKTDEGKKYLKCGELYKAED